MEHSFFQINKYLIFTYLVYLGQVDNIPVFTLTDEAVIKAYTKPSPQYLTQIVNGLRETYNYSNDQIYQYLKTRCGIVGSYKDYELYDLVVGLLNPKRDMTLKIFSDYAKEYNSMREDEEKDKMKFAMDELIASITAVLILIILE